MRQNCCLWLAILCFSLFGQVPLASAASNLSVCNGVEGLCGFLVNEIVFGMVHNAMSSPSHGFSIFANHENDPIVDSLDAGYRGLSLDICRCNGNLVLCHGGSQVGCGVGSRDVNETFAKIDQWLEDNPQDVVTIFLEVNNDAGGGKPISLLDDVYNSLPASLIAKLYDHESGYDRWPTLGEMIDVCKQVVFFYSRGPEGNPPSGNPPGIHFFFDFASQTKFSHTGVSGLEQDACDIFRAGTEQDFFLLNNFVLENSIAPSKAAAGTINNVSFVDPLIERCEASTGQSVNFVSVDFWKTGNIPEMVHLRNTALVQSDSAKAASSINSNNCQQPTQTEPPTSGSKEKNLSHSAVLFLGLLQLAAL